MARKTIADIDPKLQSILEEFKTVSEVKYELAMDAYDVQDIETRRVIDRIVATLQQSATGYITAKVGRTMVPIKIDAEYLGFNLLYLAVEIVKDCAFMGIQVASFKFPEQICASCGVELNDKTVHRVGKKKVKRGA